jgi:Protein of unknown function DUF262
MLKDEIDRAKRSVATDTVQMTIGEVSNMYSTSELNIIPEFQRLFRWTPGRKSSFVESILIGIPIPSAFVFEKEDGTWELIDGLQRISTVLEFMGLLKDPDTGDFRRSTLLETKYLPSLDGIVWEKQAEGEVGLDKPLQLFFRRHRMVFQILKHPSDPKTKFDLFQRLNRGGTYANEQEVRTCSMVLADAEFTRKLRRLADGNAFKQVFHLTPEQELQQKGLEYAVRLVAHSYKEFPKGLDVQEFLDKAILEIMDEHPVEEVMQRAEWTVDELFRLLGAEALIPPEERHEGIASRFSLRALEGIAVGLSRNKEKISTLPEAGKFIMDKIAGFWKQNDVAEMSQSGLRGTVRIQRSVPFGASWFDPDA